MTDYQGQLQDHLQQVAEWKMMRDAQTEGSRLYLHFQDCITNATEMYLAWETAGPKLQELDQRIRDLVEHITDAETEDGYDDWAYRGMASGGLGLVIFLICLWLDPMWLVWAIAFGLLGFGMFSLFRSTTEKRQERINLVDAKADLQDLQQQREALLPKASVF